MWKKYWQVDVFSEIPLAGNAAAVIFDGEGLDGNLMQSIARELNLSETAYLLKPTTPHADYRVRIFTPRNELPFAGHPTIAAAFCHLAARGQCSLEHGHRLTQECALGLVPVAIERGSPVIRFTQTLREAKRVPLTPEEWAVVLGLGTEDLAAVAPEIVSTGVRWAVVQLASVAILRRVKPDLRAVDGLSRRFGCDGVTAFAFNPSTEEGAVHVRTFAPLNGIHEDSVCGSGNGSVAAYIARHRLIAGNRFSYLAVQGAEVKRQGYVHVSVDTTMPKVTVKVGGTAVLAAVGRIRACPRG